jgi:adenylate cyclase
VPYPSLVLEMLRTAQKIPQITIHASQHKDNSVHSILGVSLGNQFLHTDSTGQVTVNYRGPGLTFPYVSAADLLQGENSARLKDAYVLVGTSAAGLLDLRATPFSNVYPGVEVHATLIDNLLHNDPFQHDIFTEIGLTYTVIILGGLLLTTLLSYSSPLIGGFGGMTLIVLCLFYGNYQHLFLNHQLAGITYPLATIFTIFLFVTLFNYFFKDREKRFVQGAFGHYVSPDVVKELINSPEKLSLAGREKVITIFFNDIRGFTSISERMDSKQLGLFMNEYLTAMSTVIMANKGTVDKFIGDAIMALWGAPLNDENHAANAVRASLQMMQTLQTMRGVWAEQGLPPIDIGIGLNTGMVSVGNFGSNQRFDYTVIGDNVNLASRLEGLNKIYGTNILISESTLEALKGRFVYRFVDLVRVKGKTKPVAIYEPILEGEAPASLQKDLEEFQHAIDLYRQRAFDQSLRIIQQLQMNKPDTLYKLYISRINHFRQNTPPAEWDGVYTATSK